MSTISSDPGEFLKSPEKLARLLKPSDDDNIQIFLYKTAISKEIPLKYLLIQLDTGDPYFFIGSLDLETSDLSIYPNIKFITLFEFINNLHQEGLDITQIWSSIQSLSGNFLDESQFIFSLLSAVPSYSQDESVLNKINDFAETPYESIEKLNDDYIAWINIIQKDIEDDLILLRSLVEIQELTALSEQDDGVTYLYKISIAVGLPLKYLLIKYLPISGFSFVIDKDLEKYPDATFSTLFEYIKNLLQEKFGLYEIWEIIAALPGNFLHPLEFISAILYAIPEYKENPAIIDIFNEFLKEKKYTKRYPNLDQLLFQYDDWNQKFQQDLTKDKEILKNYVKYQNLTKPSEYDNSVTLLYKKAASLQVPIKYVLIKPREEKENILIGTFNLEENKDSDFITLFEFIGDQVNKNPDIEFSEIWDLVSNFRSDFIGPFNLISSILYAVPGYLDPEYYKDPKVLEKINNMLSHARYSNKYDNMNQVIENYNNWYKNYQEEFAEDMNVLESYVKSQDELSNINPLIYGPLIIDNVVVSYTLKAEPGINPLPDIFDSTKNSYIVPFIQQNITQIKDQDEKVPRYYKIYRGRSIELQPVYSNIIIETKKAKYGNTIYFNIYSDEKDEQDIMEEDARQSHKKSFKIAGIHYNEINETLQITINSPRRKDVTEWTLIERLHDHVDHPLLIRKPEKHEVKELEIGGYFMIYNANFNHYLLSYLIMNDPLFSSFIYLEETSKNFPFQPAYNIHYRGVSLRKEDKLDRPGKSRAKSSVSATLSVETIPANEFFKIQKGEIISKERRNEPIYAIRVKIKKSTSRAVAEQFIKVITRLFRRYLYEGEKISEEYENFVPEYKTLRLEKEDIGEYVVESYEKTGSLLSDLKKYSPEVFLKGYAKRCQKPRQPIPIRSAEEEIRIKQNLVVEDDNLKPRPVISYPKDKAKYKFSCDSKDYPFVGVVENLKLTNREQFPYLPCCFKDSATADATIREYYGGKGLIIEKRRKKVSRKGRDMTGKFFLEEDQLGLIDTQLLSYLQKYYPESEMGAEPKEFLRFGMPRNYNSFLHCIFRALLSEEYLKSDRETFVANFRQNILKNHNLYPELVKQELYDRSLEDIRTSIVDLDTLFDPIWYYRLVETLFNVNIYIFSYDDRDHKTGQKISLLNLPRYKHFHSHPPYPGRPVILILRHYGSPSEDQSYPNCELIVERKGSSYGYQFGDRMNQLLYPALAFVGRTLTWQVLEWQKEGQTLKEMTTRINVYSSVNYEILFGEIPIIGQIIDASGKTRMLALAPQWQNKKHTEYSSLQIYGKSVV